MKVSTLRVLKPAPDRARGFTLLELLVVILIIGLLTGIVAPRFLAQIGRSEATAARAQLDAFDKALQAYRIDTGRYPSTAQGLKALVSQPADEPRWRGPYMRDDIPLDPWGRAGAPRPPRRARSLIPQTRRCRPIASTPAGILRRLGGSRRWCLNPPMSRAGAGRTCATTFRWTRGAASISTATPGRPAKTT